MAPTESTILTNFLLPPVLLPTIITLKAFAGLFPRSQQSSPQIKVLYRDLQHQRARLADNVGRNVSAELKRGNAEQREVARARRIAEREEPDDEVEVENALNNGQTSNLPISHSHSLTSILPELEKAIEEMEDDIRRDEEEAEALLEEMQTIVGGLSDLRYGRLADGELRKQVLDGLGRLESSCSNEKEPLQSGTASWRTGLELYTH